MPASMLRTCLSALGGSGSAEVEYIDLSSGSDYLDEVCRFISASYVFDQAATSAQPDECGSGSSYVYPGPCENGWLGDDCTHDCTSGSQYTGFYCTTTVPVSTNNFMFLLGTHLLH